MRINTEFICELVKVLDKIAQADMFIGSKVELKNRDTGLKVALYPLQKHYWRIDIVDMKKRDLTPVIFEDNNDNIQGGEGNETKQD